MILAAPIGSGHDFKGAIRGRRLQSGAYADGPSVQRPGTIVMDELAIAIIGILGFVGFAALIFAFALFEFSDSKSE